MEYPEEYSARDSCVSPSLNRGFWLLTAALLGAISLLKGIRMPSRWAATQALVNYNFGFVKRGLFGATLGSLFHLQRYVFFSIYSYCLLILLIGALVLLTIRSHIFERIGKGRVVALFFSSYSITYLGHLVGYMDILLAIVCAGLLLIEDPSIRGLISIPVCAVALLIHEDFLIIFLPVVLLSFLADLLRHPRLISRILWTCGMVAGFSVGITLKLALLSPLSAQQVAGMRAEFMRRADFPVREDFFSVYTSSAKDNMWMMKDHFLHNPRWLLTFFTAIFIFLPVLILLIWSWKMILDTFPVSRIRKILMGAGMLATLSPLLMNLLGWDCGRWGALACLNAFFVALIFSQRVSREIEIRVPPKYQRAVILAIALSMATGDGLMDGKYASAYPFSNSMKDLVHSVRTTGWCPPAS